MLVGIEPFPDEAHAHAHAHGVALTLGDQVERSAQLHCESFDQVGPEPFALDQLIGRTGIGHRAINDLDNNLTVRLQPHGQVQQLFPVLSPM